MPTRCSSRPPTSSRAPSPRTADVPHRRRPHSVLSAGRVNAAAPASPAGRPPRTDPGGAPLKIRDRGERMAVTDTADFGTKESFAALLDESLGVGTSGLEGTVVKGKVI